jgi:K+/H+ antiporter YhaU regulatory subunit KhtT
MNWENIRSDIQSMSLKFSEKAGEFLKESTEAIKSGAGKAAAKTSYTAQLASLNWQEQGIQKKMQAKYTELGSLAYQLKREDRMKEFDTLASDHFNGLKSLQDEISEIDKKKEALAQEYEIEKDEHDNIQSLTRDLHTGGGIISQFAVNSDSPLVGKKLMDVRLPKEALFATIVRGEEVIIPDGKTIFLEGDKVSILGKEEDVVKAVAELSPKQEEENQEESES